MSTVLLVDNDPQILAGLEMLLALEPGLMVIGAATTVAAGIDLATRHRPDIVVMDVRLPDGDGIAATRALRAALPESRIVILSLYADPATRRRAERAGAHAFVARHDLSDALLSTIRDLAGTTPAGPGPCATPPSPVESAHEQRPRSCRPPD